MAKQSFKLKYKLLLFKLMVNIDPAVMEGYLLHYDTRHVLFDINTQVNVMIGVMINSINESDLELIDRMYLNEEAIYKHLKLRYAILFKKFNKLLKDIKDSGVSIKDLDFGCGINWFRDMYEDRTRIFKIICNAHPDLAFKTRKHFDEENDPMFNGDFLVGINTPLGVVTYHLKLEYFDDFNVPEIERGPKYENYTIQDGLYRLASIVDKDLVIEHLKKKEEKQRILNKKTGVS